MHVLWWRAFVPGVVHRCFIYKAGRKPISRDMLFIKFSKLNKCEVTKHISFCSTSFFLLMHISISSKFRCFPILWLVIDGCYGFLFALEQSQLFRLSICIGIARSCNLHPYASTESTSFSSCSNIW